MYNTIQRTNNPNFCAKVSFINRINKDAKKLATIIEERTKDFPNSKIEINATPAGELMTVLIDGSKRFTFDPKGSAYLNHKDEQYIAERILQLFNLHIYGEKVKNFFEEFSAKINDAATKLDLNAGCGNTIFNVWAKKPMGVSLKEHIDHVIYVHSRGSREFKDMIYEDLSSTAK